MIVCKHIAMCIRTMCIVYFMRIIKHKSISAMLFSSLFFCFYFFFVFVCRFCFNFWIVTKQFGRISYWVHFLYRIVSYRMCMKFIRNFLSHIESISLIFFMRFGCIANRCRKHLYCFWIYAFIFRFPFWKRIKLCKSGLICLYCCHNSILYFWFIACAMRMYFYCSKINSGFSTIPF